MEYISIKRITYDLGNIKLFIFDTYNANKPTIICLHGLWGRAEVWVDFINHYGKDFRIIAPDIRGHGFSDKPNSFYTIEEMAEDIHCLIERLNLHDVIVFGHSMGGGIAGALAAKHGTEIRAIGILDKSASGPKQHDLKLSENIVDCDPETMKWQLPFSSLSEAKNSIKRTQGSELSFQYFMNSLCETPEGYSFMYSRKAISAYIQNYSNWYNLLNKIKCPTLLIRASSHDAVSDEDFIKMQSKLQNCMPYTMSHPDHNVHLSNKEEFYQTCDHFFMTLE